MFAHALGLLGDQNQLSLPHLPNGGQLSFLVDVEGPELPRLHGCVSKLENGFIPVLRWC